jgi:glycopeptide antibiotics resistance protein
MHSPDRKPSALGYALLTYMTLVVAAITLIPFEFKIPRRICINLHGSVSDVLANIVLFIPLGFLFHLARRRAGWPSLLQALGFGVLVSSAVEACQLFLPGRDSSLIDVATNGLGALLGAAAAAYQRTSVRQEQVPLLFAFEMPLMNVAYLLIPLLWLGGLSTGGELVRLGLTTVLGVFGGSVIASVYVNRLGCDKTHDGLMPALYASCWFMIGTLPAVAAFPVEVLAAAGIVALAAQLSARLWKRGNKSERRFELPTLKKVFPLYGLYLLLLSVWPTTLPLAGWSNSLDYGRLTEVQRIVFASRFIEVIAAFTLLGYMAAGMRGRKNESALNMLSWVFGSALAFSILTAVLRYFLSRPLSSVLEATLFTTAALYGAFTYRLQLAGVRRMQAQEKRL